MELFDVFLKLIHQMSLIDSDSMRQLKIDVKEWRDDATPESKDKVKATYAKMHKGVLIKLVMPFLFYYLFKTFREVLNPTQDVYDVDEDRY